MCEGNCGAVDWCPLFTQTLNKVAETDNTSKREHNAYDVIDETERKRLAFQLELTRDIDVSVLKRLIKNKDSDLNILDIGCNDGSWLLDRLRVLGVQCRVAGVDINEAILAAAKDKFPELCTVCADCESESFVTDFQKIVPETVKFDVIVLSMVLLHVGNPRAVLCNVRKLLKPNGFVYIRDMDDGLTMAYPDNECIFERVRNICDLVKYTGYRHSGREIYGMLQQCGYNKIKSIPIEVDVTRAASNDFDFRENLYTVNYGFLLGDTVLAANDDPSRYAQDVTWLKNMGLPKLNEMFHTSEFYYRMGLVGFIAER